MKPSRRLNADLPAVKIMGKWGSNTAFARALGRAPSTTDRWVRNGHIPGDELPAVIAAANKCRIDITPEDCVDMRLFPPVPVEDIVEIPAADEPVDAPVTPKPRRGKGPYVRKSTARAKAGAARASKRGKA